MADKLEVAIGLRTGEFSQGVAQVKGDLQNLSGSVQSIGGSFGRLGGLLSGAVTAGLAAAAASVAALGTAIIASGRAYLEFGDQLNKTSQKIGISAESMSQLAYAAQLSDVSYKQLETSLLQLSKKMDAAGSGNKKAIEDFQTLGVSLTDASGKMRPVASVLVDLSEAFKKMPDGANESAIAMRLFGRSGAQLLPLLNQGKEGLQQMAEEARKAGIVFSTEGAQSAEKYNDALTKMGTAIRGFGVQLWEQLVGPMAESADQLANWAIESGAAASAGRTLGGIISTAASGFSELISVLVNYSAPGLLIGNFNNLVTAIQNFSSQGLTALQNFVSSIPGMFPQVTAAIQPMIEAFTNLGSEISRIFGELAAPIGEALVSVGASIMEQVNQWMPGISEALSSGIEGISAIFSNLGASVVGLLDEIFSSWIAAATQAANGITEALRGINVQEILTSIQGFIQQVVQLFQSLPAQIQAALQGLGTAIVSAFENAFAAARAKVDEFWNYVVEKFNSIKSTVSSIFGFGGGGGAAGGAGGAGVQRGIMPFVSLLNEENNLIRSTSRALIAPFAGGGGSGAYTSGRGLFEEYVAGATEQLNQFTQAATTAKAASDSLGQSQTSLGNNMKQMSTAAQTATQQLQQQQQAAQQAAQQLGQGIGNAFGQFFSSIIGGSKKSKDAFKDLMKSLLQQIMQFMIQSIVKQFMSSFMGGGMGGGGLFGGLFGGGGGGGLGGIFGFSAARSLASPASAISAFGPMAARNNAASITSLMQAAKSSVSGQAVTLINTSENNVDLNVKRGPDGMTIEVALSRATQEVLRGGTSFSAALERTYGLQRIGY